MIRGTHELYSRFPWMQNYPNMALYIIRYGMDDLIQIPFMANDIESAEAIYKKCVEEGKTWREILDVKESDDENIIL